MSAYPHIKNDFVIIRKPETKDAPKLRFLFEHPLSIIKTEEMLAALEGKYKRLEELAMTIADKNNQPVGMLELYDLQEKTVEIGYRILPARQKQGYASQAVAEILAWLKTTSVQKVIARTAVENEASQKVLLKNGFVLVQTAKICVYEYDMEETHDEN